MDQERFYAVLREYLVECHPRVDPASIGKDDDLWGLGLLDSFGTVGLLCFLEEFIGHRIPFAHHSPKVFHTMAHIYRTFVACTEAVAPD